MSSSSPRGGDAIASEGSLQTSARTSTNPLDPIDGSPRGTDISGGHAIHNDYSSESTPQYPGLSVSPSLQFDTLSISSSSYATSYTANSDFTSDYHETGSTQFSFAQEAMEIQNQLNALFSNEMFDKFFTSVAPQETSLQSTEGGFTVSELPSSSEPSYGAHSDFPFSTNPADVQPFMASMDSFDYDFTSSFHLDETDPGVAPSSSSGPPVFQLGGHSSAEPNKPTPADLQYYRECSGTS